MSNLYIDLLKAFREIGQLQNNQKVIERTEYLLKQAKQKNTRRKRVTQENLEAMNMQFLKEDIDYTDETYLYKPYWYFTKHGMGPGSVPAKTSVWTWFETPEGTYFATSRILSTKELKEFEIVEKQPNLEDIPEKSREDIQDFLEAPITDADMNIVAKI